MGDTSSSLQCDLFLCCEIKLLVKSQNPYADYGSISIPTQLFQKLFVKYHNGNLVLKGSSWFFLVLLLVRGGRAWRLSKPS